MSIACRARSAGRFFRQGVQQCLGERLHFGCTVFNDGFVGSAAGIDHHIEIVVIGPAAHVTPTHVLRVTRTKVLCRVAALT